jgi:predicted cobalt transporter CbtA
MSMFRYFVFVAVIAAFVAAIVVFIAWLIQWRLAVIEARAYKYQSDEAGRASDTIKKMYKPHLRKSKYGASYKRRSGRK